MSREILLQVDALAHEKNVDKSVIFSALELALASANKKRFKDDVDVRVAIDPATGEYRSFRRWTVVAEDALENPAAQMVVGDERAQGLNEGETIEETLRREIAEETGITDVRITGFLGVLAGAKQDDVVYAFVGETSEEPKLMEPEKFSEWMWAEPGEIKDFINPATLGLIREHIRKNKLL